MTMYSSILSQAVSNNYHSIVLQPVRVSTVQEKFVYLYVFSFNFTTFCADFLTIVGNNINLKKEMLDSNVTISQSNINQVWK